MVRITSARLQTVVGEASMEKQTIPSGVIHGPNRNQAAESSSHTQAMVGRAGIQTTESSPSTYMTQREQNEDVEKNGSGDLPALIKRRIALDFKWVIETDSDGCFKFRDTTSESRAVEEGARSESNNAIVSPPGTRVIDGEIRISPEPHERQSRANFEKAEIEISPGRDHGPGAKNTDYKDPCGHEAPSSSYIPGRGLKRIKLKVNRPQEHTKTQRSSPLDGKGQARLGSTERDKSCGEEKVTIETQRRPQRLRLRTKPRAEMMKVPPIGSSEDSESSRGDSGGNKRKRDGGVGDETIFQQKKRFRGSTSAPGSGGTGIGGDEPGVSTPAPSSTEGTPSPPDFSPITPSPTQHPRQTPTYAPITWPTMPYFTPPPPDPDDPYPSIEPDTDQYLVCEEFEDEDPETIVLAAFGSEDGSRLAHLYRVWIAGSALSPECRSQSPRQLSLERCENPREKEKACDLPKRAQSEPAHGQ